MTEVLAVFILQINSLRVFLAVEVFRGLELQSKVGPLIHFSLPSETWAKQHVLFFAERLNQFILQELLLISYYCQENIQTWDRNDFSLFA